MEFKYYHLIQDILGVLIGAVGLRFMQIYYVFMKKRGLKLDFFLCFIGNFLLLLSGISLVYFRWGLRAWGISIGLFVAGRLLGTIVYWTMVKPDLEKNKLE